DLYAEQVRGGRRGTEYGVHPTIYVGPLDRGYRESFGLFALSRQSIGAVGNHSAYGYGCWDLLCDSDRGRSLDAVARGVVRPDLFRDHFAAGVVHSAAAGI